MARGTIQPSELVRQNNALHAHQVAVRHKKAQHRRGTASCVLSDSTLRAAPCAWTATLVAARFKQGHQNAYCVLSDSTLRAALCAWTATLVAARFKQGHQNAFFVLLDSTLRAALCAWTATLEGTVLAVRPPARARGRARQADMALLARPPARARGLARQAGTLMLVTEVAQSAFQANTAQLAWAIVSRVLEENMVTPMVKPVRTVAWTVQRGRILHRVQHHAIYVAWERLIRTTNHLRCVRTAKLVFSPQKVTMGIASIVHSGIMTLTRIPQHRATLTMRRAPGPNVVMQSLC